MPTSPGASSVSPSNAAMTPTPATTRANSTSSQNLTYVTVRGRRVVPDAASTLRRMSQGSLFDLSDESPPLVTGSALVVAATDGSARPNPGHAAGAWFVSSSCWQAVAVEGVSTNNIGELTAMHALLTAVPPEHPLHVVYDSTYAQQCLTTWVRGWSRSGSVPPGRWLTKDKKPVKNAELIAATHALLRGRTVTWSKVKSHTTLTTSEHALNREADERAAATVAAMAVGRAPSLGPGWTG